MHTLTKEKKIGVALSYTHTAEEEMFWSHVFEIDF